jgi:hypothetical protein
MSLAAVSEAETSLLMFTTERLTARTNGEREVGGTKLGIPACPEGSSRHNNGPPLLPGRVGPVRPALDPLGLERDEASAAGVRSVAA